MAPHSGGKEKTRWKITLLTLQLQAMPKSLPYTKCSKLDFFLLFPSLSLSTIQILMSDHALVIKQIIQGLKTEQGSVEVFCALLWTLSILSLQALLSFYASYKKKKRQNTIRDLEAQLLSKLGDSCASLSENYCALLTVQYDGFFFFKASQLYRPATRPVQLLLFHIKYLYTYKYHKEYKCTNYQLSLNNFKKKMSATLPKKDNFKDDQQLSCHISKLSGNFQCGF